MQSEAFGLPNGKKAHLASFGVAVAAKVKGHKTNEAKEKYVNRMILEEMKI